MNDYTEILERAERRFPAPELPVEALFRRQDRRRRTQRITAGAVGLAIALALVAAGMGIVRSDRAPAHPAIPTATPARPNVAPARHNGPITVAEHDGLVSLDPRTGKQAGSTIDCPESCNTGEIWDVDWSPDGRHVVFIWNCVSCPNGLSTYGIYVQDVVTGEQRQLTSGITTTTARWSPDGTRIAYVDSGEIHVMSSDGSQDAIVPLDKTYAVDSLSWSPDGTRLVFGDQSKNIHIVGLDGSGLHLLLRGGSVPIWTPSGTDVLYLRACSVWMAPADGTTPVLLADLKDQADTQAPYRCQTVETLGDGAFPFRQPAVSPDGRRLVVMGPNDAIVVMRIDGSHVRTIATSRTFSRLAWQPVA